MLDIHSGLLIHKHTYTFPLTHTCTHTYIHKYIYTYKALVAGFSFVKFIPRSPHWAEHPLLPLRFHSSRVDWDTEDSILAVPPVLQDLKIVKHALVFILSCIRQCKSFPEMLHNSRSQFNVSWITSNLLSMVCCPASAQISLILATASEALALLCHMPSMSSSPTSLWTHCCIVYLKFINNHWGLPVFWGDHPLPQVWAPFSGRLQFV